MGDAGADLTLNSMAAMTLAEIVRLVKAQGWAERETEDSREGWSQP